MCIAGPRATVSMSISSMRKINWSTRDLFQPVDYAIGLGRQSMCHDNGMLYDLCSAKNEKFILGLAMT